MVLTDLGHLFPRAAFPEDLEQLEGLLRSSLKTELWTRQHIIRFLSEPANGHIYVMSNREGEIFAAVLYCVVAPQLVRIHHIAVWPDYRRRGIATSLLRSILRRWNQPYRGWRFVATVPERNLAAQKLMRRSGFRAIGTTGRDSAGDDHYLFEYRQQVAVLPAPRKKEDPEAVMMTADAEAGTGCTPLPALWPPRDPAGVPRGELAG